MNASGTIVVSSRQDDEVIDVECGLAVKGARLSVIVLLLLKHCSIFANGKNCIILLESNVHTIWSLWLDCLFYIYCEEKICLD